MTQLEDWNAQFGGEDYTSPSKSSLADFEFDRTYRVRIKSAKLTVSTRGSHQIELDLAAVKEDDTEAFTRKEWLTLPKQPTTDRQYAADQVRKWTLRRRDDLGKLLQSVDPGKYRLCEKVEGTGAARQYIAADGTVLSKDALDARKVEVNTAVMAFADDCHARIEEKQNNLEEFHLAEFYLVKKENPNNPKYPYTNYYATPDSRIPLWTGETEQ